MNSLRGLMWALALSTAASAVAAQSGPTGSLTGRVVDQSQAALPGATVTAVNTATNDTRTATTNSEGLYRLTALAVGTYRLTFQLDGFKAVRRNDVLVEAAVPEWISASPNVFAWAVACAPSCGWRYSTC